MSTGHAAGERPSASSPQALLRMRRQRRAGTDPEMAIRRLVHAAGLRYRIDAPLPLVGLRRRADMLFPGPRVAVFIDGCFWHACPLHRTAPKANDQWWADKLEANVVRDRDTDARMATAGWSVLRIWEHEDPHEASDRVIEHVRDRRQPPS